MRVLVIGVAKSGTTVISKTIQNTLGIGRYHLEPKTASFFEGLASDRAEDDVVKILYDHWMDRPRLLNSIVHNELRTNFLENVFITRDPRSEFISRLHYVAFPYFSSRVTDSAAVRDWLEIFKRLEQDEHFGMSSAVAALYDRFGVDLLGDLRRAASIRLVEYMNQLSSERKSLIKYEDFVSGNLKGHPLEGLLTGSREIGADLNRTKRSATENDWAAYVKPSDREWLAEKFDRACLAMGYDSEVPSGGIVSEENCTAYVERLIDEARRQVRT